MKEIIVFSLLVALLLLLINNSSQETSSEPDTYQKDYQDTHQKDCQEVIVHINDSCNFCCSSIEQALNKSSNNTTIQIVLADKMYLKKNLTIRNKSDITIGGSRKNTQIICISNKTGITFSDSNNITLSQLEIKNCGQIHFYPHATHKIWVALMFVNCNNIHNY